MGRIAVITYMNRNVADHVDPLTGEVNATALAEDACNHFNGFIGNEIPEEYFDAAFVVAERHEIKTGVRSGNLSGLSVIINALPSDWF